MIQVENVSCFYGKYQAIHDLSLQVKHGQVLGLLGPNGAGKTTTLGMLTGLQRPDSGTVLVAGYNMLTDRLQAQKQVGYLPENAPLYPHLNVQEQLGFVGRLRQLKPLKQRQNIENVIEQCQLQQVLLKKTKQLSKGYRQRVGLAMALLHEPSVVILDEPTSGLDPAQIYEMRELINNLKKTSTVVLSSHLLSEVEAVCDQVVVLYQGKTLASGDSVSLLGLRDGAMFNMEITPAKQDENVDFGSLLSGLKSLPEVASVEGRPKALRFQLSKDINGPQRIARYVLEQGWDLLSLVPVHNSLEQVFLELVEQA